LGECVTDHTHLKKQTTKKELDYHTVYSKLWTREKTEDELAKEKGFKSHTHYQKYITEEKLAKEKEFESYVKYMDTLKTVQKQLGREKELEECRIRQQKLAEEKTKDEIAKELGFRSHKQYLTELEVRPL
jgi:hypothetical protein